MAGRPKGSINKRSRGVLAILKEQYDLDPILELAQLCSKTVPMVTSSGDLVEDEHGQPVMVPFLKGNELVQALGKLADKTYPTLKAQEVDHRSDGLPTVVLDMTGIAVDTKPARKRAPKKESSDA